MAFVRSIGIMAALLAGTWVALGAQSAPSTWAIVGARIVDGSGNEPFTGTVVVEGGRIRAAGRQVDVPAGATTIDGTGRTLLPGLIDLGIHLAAGTAGAITDQHRRALAALLYSGVTTAAVAGPADSAFDLLQREAGRADGGPRVVLLAHPAGPPTIADALTQRSATASSGEDAAAITSAAAALLQGNVTVLPGVTRAAPTSTRALPPLASEVAVVAGVEASAGPPEANGSQVASAVRALREARVRIAVRSDAGRPSLPYGWSTHLAARLLVDAGLTPREAVTAATSGGAWALQVHSDRGFIVSGMRADLVMVEGDPTATIDDLARIDRVFLGGQEVDRKALRAMFDVKPEVVPPTSADPAAVTPASPSVAAGRGGGRKAAATPVPPAKPRRGGRRSRTTPVPAPESAPTPEATATAEAKPAEALPEPSAAPPTTSEPATPAAADPAAAAPKAGAAAVPARRATVLENALLDDFEREDERSPTTGLPWSTATEAENSSTTVIAGRIVRAFRDHALHLTARMGETTAPFARAAVTLSTDGQPRDVSRFRGLRFDARGEGRYRIVFVTRSVADGRFHESYFSGSPNWTPVSVPFASVGQNGSGDRVRWTGQDLVEIRFEAARGAGRLVWLELDNVRFY